MIVLVHGGPYGVYDLSILETRCDSKNLDRFHREAWKTNDDNFVFNGSPISHVNKLKASLLLIHSEKDRRVPFEQFEELTETLDKSDYSYESLVKGYERHSWRN